MSKMFLLILIWISLSIPCCRSSDLNKQHDARPILPDSVVQAGKPFERATVVDTTKAPAVFSDEQQAAIKQNVSIINAVIDSIVLVGGIPNRLFLHITSVTPQGGMESLAEVGQHIVVSPRYVINQHGAIDQNNEHNKKLLMLQNVRRRDTLKGEISYNLKQGWMLDELLD